MFQTEFFSYLQLGFAHISDLAAYDHILFVTALCALYDVRDWRNLLWLITAFTLGHSVTLALSTLNIITFSPSVVELLIPITIILTAAANITTLQREPEYFQQKRVQKEWLKYALALCFGFIHGMGFSTFLKSLLGKEASITLPLFAFNCGLECGQILIVGILLTLAFVMTRFAKISRRDWALIVSGAALGVALTLVLKNIS